jgi:CubicO group peptidase (beta-lactamase class C family)
MEISSVAGGAIAIVKDGRLIFMKGYGCADLENAVAMTPSTKVYMASISKQFTGYCVARLIGDGKLNLNDDIRKYIPEMQSFGHAIKVKDRPMMIPAFLAKGSGTIALTWLYLLGTVSVQWIVIGAVDGIFAMFFAVAYWATGDHPKVRQLTSHPD